ncbi:hypothetical protein [Streptomyces sp. NBC_01264]|uniref:hypothetical protein n=1 Tax=Streptomyces sp. NBC_01264 TaxID=2903804 RepID=UPI0022535770|nr:hypothetical protein [Streptomyces sp. NBC_01264]MCX4784226.1 hypothetical protein [Streptomyces sp. NBC_01264]
MAAFSPGMPGDAGVNSNIYRIRVTNAGNESSVDAALQDELGPNQLFIPAQSSFSGFPNCSFTPELTGVDCNGATLAPGQTAEIILAVQVADDACGTVTNTVRVAMLSEDGTIAEDAATSSVTLQDTSPECNGGGNGGGGSILPINLSGVLPMFNNININNNIKSPGAVNAARQKFGVKSE